jgi:hypothetical protein
MSLTKKFPLAVAAVGCLLMAGAGTAVADNTATAVSVDNPGLLSGISLANITSEPLNNCANNTPSAASLLTGTSGNICVNK